MSGPIHSALFRAKVLHQRLRVAHSFSYRLFFCYLDLDEISKLTSKGGVLATSWWRPLRYRRSDYLGPAAKPLKQAVLDEVERLSGQRPAGAVRMLTQLCTFGYAFNPVTCYYCFHDSGDLAFVLAEITNTPWGERHCYLAPASNGGAHSVFDKRFHVSPFQPMQQQYEWHFSAPGEAVSVVMHNREQGELVFSATLAAQRVALTSSNLRRLWLRHPWTTGSAILSIHWNALRLWWKGAKFHPHPKHRSNEA
ncbi:MAG: DUF1365 domain-containing protein [Planctomycetota bacterium]|jgi:hypothetical protein|nr:DUF1365 domain-containing protein [Planctomycetota bacterium]